MKVEAFEIKYEIIDNQKTMLPVIIVAAGSSSRMKGSNKQFLSVGGMPVIAKTLLKFEKSDSISRIILVSKKEDILKMQQVCKDYNISKVTDIAEGGNNRNESVLNGFKRLSNDEEKVLIHDGARPFVTQKMISDTVAALKTSDAALVALKVTDTVKKTDGEQTVIGTLDRENLYLAQTPQGVDVKKYLEICKEADTSEFTDDASVMEYGGYKVTVVNGSRLNIKITTPEDVPIAEAYAEIEKENGSI